MHIGKGRRRGSNRSKRHFQGGIGSFVFQMATAVHHDGRLLHPLRDQVGLPAAVNSTTADSITDSVAALPRSSSRVRSRKAHSSANPMP